MSQLEEEGGPEPRTQRRRLPCPAHSPEHPRDKEHAGSAQAQFQRRLDPRPVYPHVHCVQQRPGQNTLQGLARWQEGLEGQIREQVQRRDLAGVGTASGAWAPQAAQKGRSRAQGKPRALWLVKDECTRSQARPHGNMEL